MNKRSAVEQRKTPRISISCLVTVRTHRGTYPGLIRNISKTGFGLETTGSFHRGDDYQFEFELPGGPKMKLRGRIIRAARFSHTIQYGIKILPMSIFSSWRLQSFLNKHIFMENYENPANSKATL